MLFSSSGVVRMIPFFVKQVFAAFIFYFSHKCSVYLKKMMDKKLTKKLLKTIFLSNSFECYNTCS